jgi:hypothetical protein
MIGGQLRTGSLTSTTRITDIAGIDKFYAEGLRLDKRHTVGSGFTLATAGGTVGGNGLSGELWAQNCLITGCNYAHQPDGDWITQHGDWCIRQATAGGGAIHLYRCTFYFWHTGLINSGPINGIDEFRDCNWVIYDSRYNPKAVLYASVANGQIANSPRHSNFFYGCASTHQKVFNNAWCHDDQPQSVDGIVLEGETHFKKKLAEHFLWNQDGCPPTITGDQYTGTATFPNQSSRVTGSVFGGRPPAGDFVSGGDLQYGLVNTGPTHLGAFDGFNWPQPGTSLHPGYRE